MAFPRVKQIKSKEESFAFWNKTFDGCEIGGKCNMWQSAAQK